jgi:hypothetical protein
MGGHIHPDLVKNIIFDLEEKVMNVDPHRPLPPNISLALKIWTYGKKRSSQTLQNKNFTIRIA